MKLGILEIAIFLAFVLVLNSCGEDDSSNVNPPETGPAMVPPPDGEPYFVTDGNQNTQFGQSLAWSTDLVEWTRWNIPVRLSTGVYIGENEIIFGDNLSTTGAPILSRTDRDFSSITEFPELPPLNSGAISISKDTETIVVLDGTGNIITSTDNGQSWSQILNIPSFYPKIHHLNGQFVVYESSNNNAYVSSDGVNWNVTNHGYVIKKFSEISNGYLIEGESTNQVFRIGSDFSDVIDTINAFRVRTSFNEFVNQTNYILIDENNLEVFGTLTDTMTFDEVAVKGISIDGGDSWNYVEIDIPKDRESNSYRCLFDFVKYPDGSYVAGFWSALRNNCVNYYSKDGGITWERLNDASLFITNLQPVYYIE